MTKINDIELIVSRHPAAVEFIADCLGVGGKVPEERIPGTQLSVVTTDGRVIPVIESASTADVAGKVVAGNLPLKFAAAARAVVAIEFDGAPPRGAEYGLPEMQAAGARLERYVVEFDDEPEQEGIADSVIDKIRD